MSGARETSPEATVVALLKGRGLTLGTAESCTGGLIAKRITDIPGASQVLMGAVVSYTNRVKEKVLGVPSSLLEEVGAVSPQVAQAMARGARRVLESDLAVSVTGLAGPEEDEFGHTGGTVFLALTDETDIWTLETHLGTDRATVRNHAADLALELVRRYLSGLPVLEGLPAK